MLTDVQGQEEGVLFLRRVVEEKLISPLILVGDEGTGRRFSTIQAVKEIFCTGTREKGCVCVDCVQVDQNFHPDLTVLSPVEDKDIGVDLIREVVSQSDNTPSMAPYRCFLIDGADRMTTPAANALLKTLEEPPTSTRFFLLAESYDRVLPTIRSRCGKVSYSALPENFVLSVIQQYEPDHAKALVYTRMGEGSVGRASRYWSAGRIGLRDRVFSLLQHTLGGDLSASFSSVDGFGQDLSLGLLFLEQLLSDIVMVQHTSHLINSDLEGEISRLRETRPLSLWVRLAGGVKAIRDRYRTTRINLAFHVKTLLAQTLITG